MYFNISLAAGDVCCRAGSVDHISVMREEREDRTEILLGRVESESAESGSPPDNREE